MSESAHRIMEILRILNESHSPIGSKLIANELNKKGFNLGERAVRYHMQILDEKGYTERKGYSGREITDLGKEILEKGLVYNQIDFTHSKFEEMIYLCDFDYKTRKGNVIVNTSHIYDEKSYEIIKKIFKSSLCVSPYIKKTKLSNEKGYEIETICGTTIDGILLNNSIPSLPLYGGLLKIEDYIPIKFNELISYKETSINPLDAFVGKDMTSILNVIKEGNGYVPANFRLIPSSAKTKTLQILEDLKNIGINGVIKVGEPGENVLGIPVTDNMVGIAIIGGIVPLSGAQELNCNIKININENLSNFQHLTPIVKNNTNILKKASESSSSQIPFLLSKSWNLIEEVDFDINTGKGNIIANISRIDEKDLDNAIDIMKETYTNSPEHINPFYKIIKHNNGKVDIATVCSLSIDGILINNHIMSTPKYGGLLELEDHPMFIELISYNGSSIDPHKIFIYKHLTSVHKENFESKRVLASLKEVSYVAKSESEEILSKLEKIGFSIYKISNPRELIYNAKIDNYNFGIVAGSGLNTIAAIKENNINIEVKALEKLIPFNEMDHF